jgi:hypothetical protein
MTPLYSNHIRPTFVLVGLLLVGACSVQAGDAPDAAPPGTEDIALGSGGTAGTLRPQATGGAFGSGGNLVYDSTTVAYDHNLTGNTEKGADWNYSFLQAGDTATDKLLYGGFTFPMPSLPSGAFVTSATLRMQVSNTVGSPGATALGDYVLDHVTFGSRGTIDTATVLKSSFATLFLNSESIVAGAPAKQIVVTDLVRATLAAQEPRIQFRIRSTGVRLNGSKDRLSIRRVENENDVAAGVLNPDPNNYLLLSISYTYEQ